MDRRTHLKMLGLLVSGPLAASARALAADAPSRSGQPAVSRRIRYALTAQNQGSSAIAQPSLLVHAPVRQTSTQRVDALSCTQPALVESDVFGNQTLRVQLEPLAPYAARMVTIDGELMLTDTPQAEALPPLLQKSYRASERYVEAADPQIQTLASKLKSDSALRTAENIFEFMHRALHADEYRERQWGAVRALQERAGSCADHACLFAALMRAAGHPARVVGGYVGADSAVLRVYDYHSWAEFHDEGTWRLADVHQSRFARNAARYIAMRIGLNTAPGSLGADQRFRALGRALTVTMS